MDIHDFLEFKLGNNYRCNITNYIGVATNKQIDLNGVFWIQLQAKGHGNTVPSPCHSPLDKVTPVDL